MSQLEISGLSKDDRSHDDSTLLCENDAKRFSMLFSYCFVSSNIVTN